MKYKFGKTIIIGLGGSIMVPDEIDWKFLREFKKFVKPWLRRTKLVIVAGGGRLSRKYQEAASRVERLTDEDKDWLGIHATRLNAHLLRTIFRDVADPMIIDSREKVSARGGKLKYPVTVASGWRPGWSTDFIAVALAQDLGVSEVIISGKPAYVYNKDNQKYPDAKPLCELSWKEYRKLIPRKWIPGAHAPVDPVAARLADRENLKAIIVNGRDLKNFRQMLLGKEFRGTIIS